MLAAVAGYLIWLLPRPRAVGCSDWQIVLPNAALTLVQIGIGVLDLVLSALANYVLLPAAPPLEFANLVVVFVISALLGFLSYAPGSLGVFEAAMLSGLPQFEKEQLLASLLLFRLLYFVLPLCLALLALGIRDACLWLSSQHAAQNFRGRSAAGVCRQALAKPPGPSRSSWREVR